MPVPNILDLAYTLDYSHTVLALCTSILYINPYSSPESSALSPDTSAFSWIAFAISAANSRSSVSETALG